MNTSTLRTAGMHQDVSHILNGDDLRYNWWNYEKTWHYEQRYKGGLFGKTVYPYHKKRKTDWSWHRKWKIITYIVMFPGHYTTKLQHANPMYWHCTSQYSIAVEPQQVQVMQLYMYKKTPCEVV